MAALGAFLSRTSESSCLLVLRLLLTAESGSRAVAQGTGKKIRSTSTHTTARPPAQVAARRRAQDCQDGTSSSSVSTVVV